MLCVMLGLDPSPLWAGADDAGGAAEPAASSDSDEGFEMLDVEPSADTGKQSGGTRTDGMTGCR